MEKAGHGGYACHPRYSLKEENSDSGSPRQKKQDPPFQITRAKRFGGMAQLVECLSNKKKALSSNLSKEKNQKCSNSSTRKQTKLFQGVTQVHKPHAPLHPGTPC
jgi:hypothetical protein